MTEKQVHHLLIHLIRILRQILARDPLHQIRRRHRFTLSRRITDIKLYVRFVCLLIMLQIRCFDLRTDIRSKRQMLHCIQFRQRTRHRRRRHLIISMHIVVPSIMSLTVCLILLAIHCLRMLLLLIIIIMIPLLLPLLRRWLILPSWRLLSSRCLLLFLLVLRLILRSLCFLRWRRLDRLLLFRLFVVSSVVLVLFIFIIRILVVCFLLVIRVFVFIVLLFVVLRIVASMCFLALIVVVIEVLIVVVVTVVVVIVLIAVVFPLFRRIDIFKFRRRRLSF
mmetsp:Transcript_31276/g.50277  ORF Transcript_31276/g.50277 Transcript_31276/m.50277 type:complete len:279 (-) Transcript_31276:779-1615(-)